ncbi:MAG: tetratricopeptide repeat protein, partial [Acidobacteriota bacterium]|nr:tetratricopeptide repeat protein [Acidobacteriota bacterium]
MILQFSDGSYRDRVAEYLQEQLCGGSIVDAESAEGDFSRLEDLLAAAAAKGPVQVVGLEDWPGGAASLWQAFNYHREQLADRCPVPLLLWVLRSRVRDLALEAPDFWAWRSGVFDLALASFPVETDLYERRVDRGRAPAGDRRLRIEEIDSYLEGLDRRDRPSDLELLVERGELLRDLGDFTAARESFETAVKGFREGEDRRGEALAYRQLAEVLAVQGDPDEALRLLREESLPVYERLGDVRSRAITMGQIADILFRRGDLEEALRIRREEELPVYERLGDVRSRAITMGKIADILGARGDLEEALRIRREEELPVYERLGDVRSRAITMGKIADILG